MCGIFILSLGLASVALSDWTLGQKLILDLVYLAFVGILPVLFLIFESSYPPSLPPLTILKISGDKPTPTEPVSLPSTFRGSAS